MTEQEYANKMMTLAKEAKGEIGAEKTVGFLCGILVGEVLQMGGNLADAKGVVEKTWEVFQKAKSASG